MFPDFVTPQARAWWGRRNAEHVRSGLAGIWNDMNEPATGVIAPEAMRFDGGREVSDWCRVAQLYAGGGYGSFFPPEKGDEVLVAFVQGDMRIPIVLGGLYNGQDKPSTSRDGGKDQKLIRTRGGHQLLFDDTGSDKALIRFASGL